MPEWQDNAIMLKSKKYGEKGSIVTLFTQHHGLWRGFMKQKQIRALQIGCILQTHWKAGTEDQLGYFNCEHIDMGVAYFWQNQYALAALTTACALINIMLPPQQENHALYNRFMVFLESIKQHNHDHADFIYYQACYIFFEFDLLKLCGFGFDWQRCALSDMSAHDMPLCYVSPKTGRAINNDVAQDQQRDKLLILPAFLLNYYLHHQQAESYGNKDIKDAFDLLEFFIKNYALPHQHQLFLQQRGLLVGFHTR